MTELVFRDHPTERGVRRLESTVVIPRPLHDVFAFFADAGNLAVLTPPWMHFRIVSETPIDMRAGTLIDYKLRVRLLPIRWRSEITAWEPPHRFVDTQRRGPYSRWVHEHTFEEVAGGTLVRDRVDYAVPGGRLVESLLVRRDLETIFAYRGRVLTERFGLS